MKATSDVGDDMWAMYVGRVGGEYSARTLARNGTGIPPLDRILGSILFYVKMNR